MMEIASSIQSVPSTRAYSTSFSAGKYSGKGIGSVMEFNLISFFQFAQNSSPARFFCAHILTSGQRRRGEVILNRSLSGLVLSGDFQLVPARALEVAKHEVIFVSIGAGSVGRNDRPANIA